MKPFMVLGMALMLAACGASEPAPQPAEEKDALIVAGESASHWRSGMLNPDPEIRRIMVLAVGGLAEEAVPLASDVVLRLVDEDPDVAMAARQSLLRIGPGAVTALVDALTAGELNVRAEAAHTLGSFRAAAAPAVPALGRAVTSDQAWQVRYRAAEALADIGPDARAAAADLRTAAERDEDPNVRAAAVAALERVGG